MTAQNSAKSKRHRGYILTPAGAKKLKHRISELEETTGIKYNPPKIAEQTQLISAQGLHPTTIRKILRGSSGGDRSSLQLIFQVVGLELEDSDFTQPGLPEVVSINSYQDWREAIDVSVFYGREIELATLKHWILQENCRLVTLLGIGGIGKTSLSVKLAQNLQDRFEFTIWRSLRTTPPLDELLLQLLQFFGQPLSSSLFTKTVNSSIRIHDSLRGISQLLEILRRSRCLIVLDNVESLFKSGSSAGEYREGYADYGELFRRLAETYHQSCLILTSREKPPEIAAFEGESFPVRSWQLGGLAQFESLQLLYAKGLSGSNLQLKQLVQLYDGNPLALKLVATSIQRLFAGNVADFLTQGVVVFNGIRNLLAEQFNRLSFLEQQILYWLAINRQPVTLHQLCQDIVPLISLSRLLEVLEHIGWRSLIETQTHPSGGQQFTLQPVVMEYVCDRLIEEICDEIAQTSPSHLDKFIRFRYLALIKAQSQDYIRHLQTQQILHPIAQKLITAFGSQENLIAALGDILIALRLHPPTPPGYIAGNILNLLVYLQADLSGYDFSGLTLWQADLQGVNLRYANFSQSNLDKSVFSETFSNIYGIALSPDGTQLATGHVDGEIRLWRVSDGTLLFKTTAHSHTVWSLAYSPDGRTLASGSFDGTVGLWDSQSGQIKQMLSAHADWVWAIAMSPDSQFVASASSDRTIKLWEIATGECVQTFSGHSDVVAALAFSPDGQTLASGSADCTVRLWNWKTGQCNGAKHRPEGERILRGHSEQISALCFSPDSETLASCQTQAIRLWDLETGECYQTLTDKLTFVWSILFSPDGQQVIYGDGSTIQIWDADLEDPQQSLSGYTSQIWAIATSAQGQLIAGSDKQTLKLWQRSSHYHYELWRTLSSYTRSVWAVAWSPDGKSYVSGGTDAAISLWNTETQACMRLLCLHQDTIRALAISPDAQLIASGSEDKTIRLWDKTLGKARLPLLGHSDCVWSVSFSPNGSLLASSSSDRTLRLWEVSSGRCLHILRGHQSWVFSVAFSPNGQLLASSSADQSIRLWDVETGKQLTLLLGHQGLVASVAFSPDGRFLASGSEDQTIKIWDIQTGQCIHTLTGHQNLVWSVAFCPMLTALANQSDLPLQLLASGSVDQTIHLWDTKTGECLQVLAGHNSAVWTLAFSPDGQTLLSGSKDETLKLWNVTTRQCLDTLHPERIYESMNISGVTGLTEAQKETLKALGAVEQCESRG